MTADAAVAAALSCCFPIETMEVTAETWTTEPCSTRRASTRSQPGRHATRPKSLEGVTIGLLDIGKARGDVFLDRLDERLTERGITVKRYAKPTPSRLVAADTKAKMLSEVQAAVIGLAD